MRTDLVSTRVTVQTTYYYQLNVNGFYGLQAIVCSVLKLFDND